MADGQQPGPPTVGETAKFTAMQDGAQEDWTIIAKHAGAFNKGLADRVLAHLKLLDGDFGGYPVDRLTHSLQTATRAHRAGRDEEYVICALLHDIGDTLGSTNHADIGAAILKPFVTEQNHWMLENHGIFQGYYFFHYLGLDRDLRDQYRGHRHFEDTARFCEQYDQSSFDPAYDTMPLEAFTAMVQRVMSAPKRSIYLRSA